MMIAPSSIEWVASGLARVLLNEDGLLVISGRQDYSADEIHRIDDLVKSAEAVIALGEAPIPVPRGQL